MAGALKFGCYMIAAAVAAAGSVAAQPAPDQPAVIANIDLTKPFDGRSDWRFVATQGPEVPGDLGGTDPGVVQMCLKKGGATSCAAPLETAPHGYWEAHYLEKAQVVRSEKPSTQPLLLLRTTNLPSGDGNQALFTQLLAYRRQSDRFERVYAYQVGKNNNQEVRFIASGPLAGDVISAEPTSDAPFGFWIAVSRLGADQTYHQTLRYRSATHYGDGNRLAVIDFETPNVEARLGVWRPGAPLPLPAGPCPKPRLAQMELWCD